MYVVVFNRCIHSSYHIFSTKTQLKKAAKAYEKAVSDYQSDHNNDFREEVLKQYSVFSVTGDRDKDWEVKHVFVGWYGDDEDVNTLNEFVNSF